MGSTFWTSKEKRGKIWLAKHGRRPVVAKRTINTKTILSLNTLLLWWYSLSNFGAEGQQFNRSILPKKRSRIFIRNYNMCQDLDMFVYFLKITYIWACEAFFKVGWGYRLATPTILSRSCHMLLFPFSKT